MGVSLPVSSIHNNIYLLSIYLPFEKPKANLATLNASKAFVLHGKPIEPLKYEWPDGEATKAL